MFTFVSPIWTAVFLARIVMPFSRSRSIESSTRSATSWFSRKEPDCQSSASTSVVLPWSTWATIATLRRSSRRAVRLGSDIAITLAVDCSVQFRHRAVAVLRDFSGGMSAMGDEPTVKQIYALAAALCSAGGLAFPETREAASELIERVRLEIGHPAPRLADTPLRRRRRRRRGLGRTGLGAHDWRASDVAAELVREMR